MRARVANVRRLSGVSWLQNGGPRLHFNNLDRQRVYTVRPNEGDCHYSGGWTGNTNGVCSRRKGRKTCGQQAISGTRRHSGIGAHASPIREQSSSKRNNRRSAQTGDCAVPRTTGEGIARNSEKESNVR